MSSQDTKVRIKPNLKYADPVLFKVIYLNDDVTTADFVVETLINHFSYSADRAVTVMENIHNDGSAVVSILPYEIAEQRGIEVTVEARSRGFPLIVKIEADE